MHLDVSHSFISVNTSTGEGVLTVCIRSYFLQTLHRIMPSYIGLNLPSFFCILYLFIAVNLASILLLSIMF